ncbi:CDP-glucose 4,6-dehydratase [Azospirillum sp.]|uniref:CDP-glucose 4,6-dehydratase n=1 Tax=Azospirillum sp. TaxID=34012 RepID=UPI002D24AE00|nr:CDP-glucose 4,6-dehydratase [Azospirillum sp.]HYD63875.1 CDP-glucose 4,6-dehydratase [Azospirillum sp.]
MNRDFWTGRRVFVTGHTGFKGGWLCLWLQRLGAEVSGYALTPPTEPNLFTAADVGAGMESTIGDVRDPAALEAALRRCAPDVVIHMAAQPLVLQSYAEPVATYETNVIGTVNVLEAVRRVGGVAATVVVTSDKCYENRETIWGYREGDALGGHDPYSSSKACTELVTASYGKSFFAADERLGGIASVRAGNVVGGGDWAANRLMVDLMRGLSAGETVRIRQPAAVRPWQHVLEPLSGYLAVAERLCTRPKGPWDAWNFGPDGGSERTTLDVARSVCALWGTPDRLRVDADPRQPHEAGLLTLDSTKARRLLGWWPRWDFEETLTQTVAWYRAHAEGRAMQAFTLDQIDLYERASSAPAAERPTLEPIADV